MDLIRGAGKEAETYVLEAFLLQNGIQESRKGHVVRHDGDSSIVRTVMVLMICSEASELREHCKCLESWGALAQYSGTLQNGWGRG